MCGLAGVFGTGDPKILAKIIKAQSHRGPDAEGIDYDPVSRVGLGHRRLAVIDLESGDQPMWNADRTIGVVFNGVIYDHRELRERLRQRHGPVHQPHPVPEVVPDPLAVGGGVDF